MHIDVPQVQTETLFFAWSNYRHWQKINNSRGVKTVPVANISIIGFSTNLELFTADLLLLNLAVSAVSKNGSLYPSCIIFKTVPFALIVSSQKLWFCFNFPLNDMYLSRFGNSNPLFLRFWKPSISSILESKELYETLSSNSVCYLLCCWTFWQSFLESFYLVTVFLPCTFGHSGESKGIVEGVTEGIVEGVVWIVFNFCPCRDWRRISILETENWVL